MFDVIIVQGMEGAGPGSFHTSEVLEEIGYGVVRSGVMGDGAYVMRPGYDSGRGCDGILLFQRFEAFREEIEGDGFRHNLCERREKGILQGIVGGRYGYEDDTGMRLCGFQPC